MSRPASKRPPEFDQALENLRAAGKNLEQSAAEMQATEQALAIVTKRVSEHADRLEFGEEEVTPIRSIPPPPRPLKT